jgi:predicted nucleic acid-binding protein
VSEPAIRVVLVDASVLINLLHIGRLGLLAELRGHEFAVINHVRDEIRAEAQRAALYEAVAAGALRAMSIEEPSVIRAFAELTARMGRGEAACLALAQSRGWWIASDEKGRFRREARERLGEDRVIGTAELLMLAIRAGVISIEQADDDRRVLEARRFRMVFESFRALISRDGGGEFNSR